MSACFERFLQERQYLHNVSPRTIEWYSNSLRWLKTDDPTQEDLNDVVLRLRASGHKPTGCNMVTRALNAYCHWLSGSKGKCGGGCNHPHIRSMKEPEFVPEIFTVEQIKKLHKFAARKFCERRLHLLILILLDTGARISEVLGLRVGDVDMDNLLLTLTGKGRKQRKVPFSWELRRHLYKYMIDFPAPGGALFADAHGRILQRNSVLHAVKHMCRRLGFEPPTRTLHAFRHTFATNYLRRGGNVFLLQKSLGHTSMDMTRRYAQLNTEDLTAMHAKISLLS